MSEENETRRCCTRWREAVWVIVVYVLSYVDVFFFFFQAEDGIRDLTVTGVQTCALPIFGLAAAPRHFLAAARRRRSSQSLSAATRRRLVLVQRRPRDCDAGFVRRVAAGDRKSVG